MVDRPPRLVFANACLSGLTSNVTAVGEQVGANRADASLVASLADKFFKQGVRDYIGTAWEISDVGAIEFANVFYRTLLTREVEEAGEARAATIGESVLMARRTLWEKRHTFGKLWAAYQHYGDPTAIIA
jgi:CHAT domain-containing protein